MKSSFINPSKKSNFLNLFVFACLLISAVSCSKGNDGPAGPTGPTGPAGPVGVAGPPGTANVTYSTWFTPSAYKKDTVFGTYGFNFDDAAPAITQNILDSGTVITYGKLDGYVTSIWPTAQVSALPISITYLSGSTPNIDTWSALITPGNLRIRLVSSLNAYGSISTAHQFRYIVIPGAVKTNAVSPSKKEGSVETNAVGVHASSSDYSQMSYHEICTMFNIPE
jgi:hypothetical protein